MNKHQLFEQIKKKQSFLCVGLDTDINKIPQELLALEDPVFEFNKQIINKTAEFAVAYKPNTAFYEVYGAKGWQSLERTIQYIKINFPDIFIIADAKRGDIGNTSANYAKAFFNTLNADALTVAPYMGFVGLDLQQRLTGFPILECRGTYVAPASFANRHHLGHFRADDVRGGCNTP